MDKLEQTTHSFIVKIWRERTSVQEERFTWRGYITHVPDGKRRAVRRLGEIVLFIGLYLHQMKVQLGLDYFLFRLAYALRTRKRRP